MPRFLPTFNFGYGYLIFSFYGPLYAWVSAGWIAILGDWQLGMVWGVATFLLAGTWVCLPRRNGCTSASPVRAGRRSSRECCLAARGWFRRT